MRVVPAFLMVAMAVLFQAAQPPVTPTPSVRVHPQESCDPVRLPDGSLSAKAGLATQGGYRFNFESLRGSGCRDYILWNTPGQESVRVKWQYDGDNSEPLLAEARLAKCPAGSGCEPTDFPKPETSLTELPGRGR